MEKEGRKEEKKKRGRKRVDEERRGNGRGEFSGFRMEHALFQT